MRTTLCRQLVRLVSTRLPVVGKDRSDLISIRNGTFWQDHPTSINDQSSNPPLFPNTTFRLAHQPTGQLNESSHFAVIGTNTTPFLKALRGDYIVTPADARVYPHLSSPEIQREDPRLAIPSRAIQYVGFTNNAGSSLGSSSGLRGSYLSARYESRREETDWTLSQYLQGKTELNPSEELAEAATGKGFFKRVVKDLNLGKLLDMPVSNLSNGQTRRSKIAKALLQKPKLLLLDEPFLGLDPPTLVKLSPMLKRLAYYANPQLVLGLRPQDPIPDWITHLVILGNNNTVVLQASMESALFAMYNWSRAVKGGPHITAKAMEEAEALVSTHGPPSFATASILTPNGIHQCEAVKQVWRTRDRPMRSLDAFRPSFILNLWANSKPRPETKSENQRILNSDLTMTQVNRIRSSIRSRPNKSETLPVQEPSVTTDASSKLPASQPLIDLNSIVVKYGDKVVLGHPPTQPGFSTQGLNLTISRGTRLLLLGPNGSGKTTLLSLLTSDHPQSYSLPIKFFGRTRLPRLGHPGLSLWEIQSRIGHSSPEVHAFYPRNQTIRQVLESAWAETFSSKPSLTPERAAMVDHFLYVWKPELCQFSLSTTASDPNKSTLDWATDKKTHPAFGRLPFGTQRLLLLLRAIIKQPDIVILDEAFSGLPTAVRNKALAWLENGTHSLKDPHSTDTVFPGLTDQQALIVVSHVREEVPDCVTEYVRLPSEEEATESQKTILTGRSEHGQIKSAEGWNRVWGL